MTTAQVLMKEKIVSISDLQKNPLKALDAKIVRIIKNGKEIGIFMSKEEFEDFVEDNIGIIEQIPENSMDYKIIKSREKNAKFVSESEAF